MAIDPNFLILSKYVNAAADLADQVRKDIQAGGQISDKTVLALSTLKTAARNAEKLLDPVIQTGIKLN